MVDIGNETAQFDRFQGQKRLWHKYRRRHDSYGKRQFRPFGLRLFEYHNLALKLVQRFDRQGKQVDLDRSVDLAQDAVNITLEGSPRYTACLNNLSNILETR